MKQIKRRRRFVPEACNHVYQRSVGGYNIFYDDEDFLMCYMILSVMAKKHGVKVVKVCFMFDHIHILLECESPAVMAAFIRDYTSTFVHEYNTSLGRKGQLFHKSFGSAPKQGSKKMRSVIVYIGNNPVEKDLCRYAEEYRWNFLKYMMNPVASKSEVPAQRCSRRLYRCMRRVKATAKVGAYMNYTQIYDLFSGLSGDERESLIDFIIKEYFPFDENIILALYDDWRQVIDAMHSSAGSEYDLKEKWYSKSDAVYQEMCAYIKEKLHIWPVRKVVQLPCAQKAFIFDELKKHTSASDYELNKFLHLAGPRT